MLLTERLHVIHYQHEIATATCSRHLPSMHLRQHGILVDEALHATLNHGWEHRYLGIERSLEGGSERLEILGEDGIPTVVGCLCQCLHLWLSDVLAIHHRTTWAARLHRNHTEMALQPVEHLVIVASLKLLWPETIVVIMTAESRHTDTDAVLRTAHDAIAALRVVLKTEHELGKNLRIHVRQLHGPYLLDHIASGSGKSATLTHLEGRYERHGDRPARCKTAHVWLVDPSTRQVETSRQLAGRVLDVGARASRQSLGRSALQHHILDATLLAELALGLAAAIGIDHKDVWFHNIYRWHEVHDAASLVDEGILDITDRFHHEETFLLRVESLMVLIAKDGLIGADTDVKVSILGCLAEKFHMTTMQKVVAATYKYFFIVCF